MAHVVRLDGEVVRFFVWMKGLPVPLWLALFGVAFLIAVVRYSTSSYVLTADENFIINTGLLGLRTPRGPFIEYQNTIACSLIADCDVSRNPIQFLFRTGTLVITSCEMNSSFSRRGTLTILLPYIAEPEKCRDALMASSQVHNARFVV